VKVSLSNCYVDRVIDKSHPRLKEENEKDSGTTVQATILAGVAKLEEKYQQG